MLENVLIAASKSHGYAADQDGGSILVRQFADYAPAWCRAVDLLLLRAADPACIKPPGIRRLAFLPPTGPAGDKFESRISAWTPFVDYLNRHGGDYDLIVVTHVSNVFGLWQVKPSVRKKIVLYPMFTGLSYRLANETVPDLYLDMERRALSACHRILTPSEAEKRQLVQGYQVDPARIEVIPRGIDRRLFAPRERALTSAERLDIVCVGAIRPQKNTLDTVRLLDELARRGVLATMHLAGAVAAPAYADECRRLAERLGVADRIVFHAVLPQEKLAALMDRCDLAISVARWETFGRGIFEGLAMGIPTLVYERLSCVWEHLDQDSGIAATGNAPAAMAARIATIVRDPGVYRTMSLRAMRATGFLDEPAVMRQVRSAWRRAAEGAIRTTMETA